MSKAYKEIMGKIEITDDMRERILQNIQTTDFQKKTKMIHFPKNRKWILAAACFAVLVVSVGIFRSVVYNYGVWKDNNLVSPDDDWHYFRINPEIMQFSSAEELSEEVGFEVCDLPELPFEVQSAEYGTYGTDAKITYYGNEEWVFYQKKLLISIDSYYTDPDSQYEDITDVSIKDVCVTLKGAGGLYTCACWEKDGYSYDLEFSIGKTRKEILRVIRKAL